METVNDLFIKALSLYDEISKTGTVDASKTADYKACIEDLRTHVQSVNCRLENIEKMIFQILIYFIAEL